MTATQADIPVSMSWVNLVALDGDLSGVEVLIQNKGQGRVHIVFGGAEPTGNTGPFLEAGVATTAIWAKSPAGPGLVAAEVR